MLSLQAARLVYGRENSYFGSWLVCKGEQIFFFFGQIVPVLRKKKKKEKGPEENAVCAQAAKTDELGFIVWLGFFNSVSM